MVTIGNDSDIFSVCSILIRNLLDVLVDHINTLFNCFTSTEHVYFFSSVSAVIPNLFLFLLLSKQFYFA